MASRSKSRKSSKRRQDNNEHGDKKKPDFSKAGRIGKIPDPVDKWVGKLGKSVPENEGFTLDGSGKEFDVEDLEEACGKTFYVVYRYAEHIDEVCEGLDFTAYVKRGEGKAKKVAKDIVDACREDGCAAGIVVEYEKWDCNATKKGGSSVNVEIALRVECVEI